MQKININAFFFLRLLLRIINRLQKSLRDKRFEIPCNLQNILCRIIQKYIYIYRPVGASNNLHSRFFFKRKKKYANAFNINRCTAENGKKKLAIIRINTVRISLITLLFDFFFTFKIYIYAYLNCALKIEFVICNLFFFTDTHPTPASRHLSLLRFDRMENKFSRA